MLLRLLPPAFRDRLAEAQPPTATPVGWVCFQIGLFLLASSALLGGVFLFIALILGSRGRERPLADPANGVLLVAALLMVIGAAAATSGWLAWVGLGNWLPFFWAFWGYQPYLATAAARRRVALMLVAGTVPAVLTGMGQLWWGWKGPFQALGGAIIWHLEAGGNPPGRLAGLFDYANIAGSWLALAWPFTLAALVQPGLSRAARGTTLAIAAAITAAVVRVQVAGQAPVGGADGRGVRPRREPEQRSRAATFVVDHLRALGHRHLAAGTDGADQPVLHHHDAILEDPAGRREDRAADDRHQR
jgi:hypothetical protein